MRSFGGTKRRRLCNLVDVRMEGVLPTTPRNGVPLALETGSARLTQKSKYPNQGRQQKRDRAEQMQQQHSDNDSKNPILCTR